MATKDRAGKDAKSLLVAIFWRLCHAASVTMAFTVHAELPEFTFTRASDKVGDSPEQKLSIDISAGSPQIYQVAVDYPAEFRFRGFNAIGPEGSEIGALTVDANGDGSADLTTPLKSLGAYRAYADQNGDGRFSPGFESVVEYRPGSDFLVTLPFGGDSDPTSNISSFSGKLGLTLKAGLIVNPPNADSYTIHVDVTPVDPDTGGPSNNGGSAPLAEQAAIQSDIGIKPFSQFLASQVRIKKQGAVILLKGHYDLAADSNGVDFAQEAVTVSFGPFQETIAAGKFVSKGSKYIYRNHDADGIRVMRFIKGKKFELEIHRAELTSFPLSTPVNLSIRLGDDRGEQTLSLNAKGRYRAGRG